MDTESSFGKARFEGTGKWSEEEAARINAAKEKLQELMDKASTTVGLALENGFISELDGARLYKFLEKVADAANKADASADDADKAAEAIEALYDRVKLPDDLKKEKIEKEGELLLQKMEEWDEKRKYENDATADIDEQLRGQKGKTNFFRGRK